MAERDHESVSRPNLILYLGDGPISGPAVYLFAVLSSLGFRTIHLPPGRPLDRSLIEKKGIRLVILSDYSYSGLRTSVSILEKRVRQEGMGLLMIGGWGSFFGGGYRGTVIEDLLPVEIKASDDRINCSSGLRLYPCGGHPVLKGLPFERGPVISGLNEVKPKRGAKTLAKCYPLLFGKTREVALAKKGFPALILDDSGAGRRGVLATDLAPHWAGGLLDWGKKRVRVRVPGRTFSIEVGDAYIRMIGNLIGWFLDENQSLRSRPGRIK